MTKAARWLAVAALGGLAVALGLMVGVPGAGSPPAPATAATLAAPCSSCDARHARLRDARNPGLERQE